MLGLWRYERSMILGSKLWPPDWAFLFKITECSGWCIRVYRSWSWLAELKWRSCVQFLFSVLSHTAHFCWRFYLLSVCERKLCVRWCNCSCAFLNCPLFLRRTLFIICDRCAVDTVCPRSRRSVRVGFQFLTSWLTKPITSDHSFPWVVDFWAKSRNFFPFHGISTFLRNLLRAGDWFSNLNRLTTSPIGKTPLQYKKYSHHWWDVV